MQWTLFAHSFLYTVIAKGLFFNYGPISCSDTNSTTASCYLNIGYAPTFYPANPYAWLVCDYYPCSLRISRRRCGRVSVLRFHRQSGCVERNCNHKFLSHAPVYRLRVRGLSGLRWNIHSALQATSPTVSANDQLILQLHIRHAVTDRHVNLCILQCRVPRQRCSIACDHLFGFHCNHSRTGDIRIICSIESGTLGGIEDITSIVAI